MLLRPKDITEGIEHLRKVLRHTESDRGDGTYATLWSACNFMAGDNRYHDNMLKPLCDKSQVARFLFMTLIPKLQAALMDREGFAESVDTALARPETPTRVAALYEIIQTLAVAVETAKQRGNNTEEMVNMVAETERFLDDRAALEGIKLIFVSKPIARKCIEIALARLADTLTHKTYIPEEKLTLDITSLFDS